MITSRASSGAAQREVLSPNVPGGPRPASLDIGREYIRRRMQ